MERKALLLLLVSIFILLLCLTSIILGILSLAYFWSAHVFPVSSGYGIWTCLMNLAAGVFGLAGSLLFKSKPRVAGAMHLQNLIWSCIAGSLLSQMMRYSITIYEECTRTDPADYCSLNKDKAIGIAIAQLVVSALLIFSCLLAAGLFMIYHCRCPKRFTVTREDRNQIMTLT